MLKDRILVGRFGSPHGVDGEIRLTSFTSDPRAIASYKPLLDESGKREFAILRLRARKENMFIAKIGGTCDRASAAVLTNAGIYLPRAAMPETSKEEYYLADLVGLKAVTGTGEFVGRVSNVYNFGGGDILELACASSDETMLLPFKKEIIPNIDLEAGQVTVLLPHEIEVKASPPATGH
jgi:16S rRNA processing protein RimM